MNSRGEDLLFQNLFEHLMIVFAYNGNMFRDGGAFAVGATSAPGPKASTNGRVYLKCQVPTRNLHHCSLSTCS
jgi:hypothetical protein